ncbi:MAG: site-specific integrase, partial [Acidobacteriota bacterium]
YRDHITPRRRSCYKEAGWLNRILKSSMSALTLDRVTPATLANFRDRRLSAVGPQAVRHDLKLLRHVFKVAMQEWDVPLSRNPMDGIRKWPQPRARERRLDEGDHARLVEAAHK